MPAKKWAKKGKSEAVAEAGQLLKQSEHAGQGYLTWVTVKNIVPDPNQPRSRFRKLGIDPGFVAGLKLAPEELSKLSKISDEETKLNERDKIIQDKLETIEDPAVRREIISIIDLATTIENGRLIQPIVVKGPSEKSGLALNSPGIEIPIKEGERRFLAHVWLGREEIQSIVIPEGKKQDLQLELQQQIDNTVEQIIENTQREALYLDELLESLERINLIHKEAYGEHVSEAFLRRKCGVSKTTGWRYYKLLNVPEDVKAAVMEKRITGLKDAVAYAGIESVEAREQVLIENEKKKAESLSTRKTQSTISSQLKNQSGKKKKVSQKRGRKSSSVTLGKTENLRAVEYIVSKVLGSRDFKKQFGDVEWKNPDSVSMAWKAFWGAIEDSIG